MLLVKRLGPSSGDTRYINDIAIAIAIATLHPPQKRLKIKTAIAQEVIFL